jgi:hypothetical protein
MLSDFYNLAYYNASDLVVNAAVVGMATVMSYREVLRVLGDDVLRLWLVQAEPAVLLLEAVAAAGKEVEQDSHVAGTFLHFRQNGPGTDVTILRIFSPKYLAKNCLFF